MGSGIGTPLIVFQIWVRHRMHGMEKTITMQQERHKFQATSSIRTIKIFFTDAQPWKRNFKASTAFLRLIYSIKMHPFAWNFID